MSAWHRSEEGKAWRREWSAKNRKKLSAQQSARRVADPERNLRIWRKSHYKTTYGITIEDYERMLFEQGGRCAICHRDKPGGRFNRFCVDHDHATGKVRGILCVGCNAGLGKYESLKDAMNAYLNKHLL